MEIQNIDEIKAKRAAEYDSYIEEHMAGEEFQGSDMCIECIATYREHYINGDLLGSDGVQASVFPPVCQGDLRKGDGDLTKAETDEELLFAMLHNPEVWAKEELGINLRSYQADSISCSSRFKTDRWGRRSGKSFSKVVDILRRMQIGYEDPNTGLIEKLKVLVLTPNQSQIDEIFLEIDNLIAKSKNLKFAVEKRRQNPQELRFTNGSRIIGYCTGGDTGASSDKIRGTGGHIIYLDEMDYIPDKHIEAVTIIVATAAGSQLWATTTPSGRRSKFWEICTNKRLRYKERHISATQSPEWNKETEQVIRLSYSQAGWDHEILAIFGVVEGGVFPTNKINGAIRPYHYGPIEDIKDYKTCIGVDWNGAKAGIPIILVGYNQKKNIYAVLDKVISQEEEFTQTAAMRDILVMYDKWKPDFIYMDAGFGQSQFETLRLEAGRRKDLKLLNCMKSIAMQSNFEVRDPINKKQIKKQAKALMVDICVQRAEADMFIFPEAENLKGQLMDQIREFVVERITSTGIPVYSQGEDHQLIAWMLAIFGITIEFSDISKITGTGIPAYTPIGIGFKGGIEEKKQPLNPAYDDLDTSHRTKAPQISKGFARTGGVLGRTISGTRTSHMKFKGRGNF